MSASTEAGETRYPRRGQRNTNLNVDNLPHYDLLLVIWDWERRTIRTLVTLSWVLEAF